MQLSEQMTHLDDRGINFHPVVALYHFLSDNQMRSCHIRYEICISEMPRFKRKRPKCLKSLYIKTEDYLTLLDSGTDHTF